MEPPVIPTHPVTPQQTLHGMTQVHIQSTTMNLTGTMSRQVEIPTVRHLMSQPNIIAVDPTTMTMGHTSIPAMN